MKIATLGYGYHLHWLTGRLVNFATFTEKSLCTARLGIFLATVSRSVYAVNPLHRQDCTEMSHRFFYMVHPKLA